MGQDKKILFVDDEANNLKAFQRLLMDEDGIVIYTAENAEKGLALLEQESVDLVVSDNKMPGMSGIEFTRLVKEKYPQLPCIMLTGYNELGHIRDQNVVSAIMTKPWDDEELKQVIFGYLQ